jgi:hypothetical protein
MKIISRLAVVPLLMFAVACGGNDKKVDDALNSDLSLASQANPAISQDSISALERANGNALAGRSAPAATRTRTVVHHVYEGSGSSGSARASAGTHIEKQTKRDAAIGAGAGAVIGAVTSKNKVKGGIIGAAAGGILGAVIGNNVDKKRVPNHP